MSKKLNITAITNELEESAFFPSNKTPNDSPASHTAPEQHNKKEGVNSSIIPPQQTEGHKDTMIPRYHDTVEPIHHDTTVPLSETDTIEEIRKVVKQIGKESATQRLTTDELQRLKDVVYTYDRQGIITTKNEIIRIATNYILLDFRKNGENSVVAKVLKKLNS